LVVALAPEVVAQAGTPVTTLFNVNNTISGAGSIGAFGDLTLNNETLGMINATGANNPLILDGRVNNAGLIEATGIAGLTINGEGIANTASGIIEANTGSLVKLQSGAITGGTLKTSGVIRIANSGSNFFKSAGSRLTSQANCSGMWQIRKARRFWPPAFAFEASD
jgi:hypothetical protein